MKIDIPAPLVMVVLGFLLVAQAEALPTNSDWRDWSRFSQKESYAKIELSYGRGGIRNRKGPMALPTLIADLKRLAPVPGHPVVVLTAPRSYRSRLRSIMAKIGATGVCRDAGCYLRLR